MAMEITTIRLVAVLYILFCLAAAGVILYLLVLVIKALRKYLSSKEVREEKQGIRRSLGEELREHRLRCKMTQEFVAESLGVSRQAVSKWENGSADPSTSNLLTLAKLYGVSPETLLQNVQAAPKKAADAAKEDSQT